MGLLNLRGWALMGLLNPILAAAQCDCISDFNYTSEILPAAAVTRTCPNTPGYYTITSSRYGDVLSDPVSPFDTYVYLNASFNQYQNGVQTSFSTWYNNGALQRQTCTEEANTLSFSLSGWNILILDRWYTMVPGMGNGRGKGNTGPATVPARMTQGVIGSMLSGFPVPDENLAGAQSFFLNRGGALPTVPGVSFFTYPRSFALSGTGPAVYKPTGSRGGANILSTNSILDDIQKTLTANGWTDFYPGMVKLGAAYYPAILKMFGTKKTVYAYYGRFKDVAEAVKYGYSTDDQLYFSKAETVPETETETAMPDLRYGSSIYRRDEVLTHRGDVEWHDQCRCSDLTYVPGDFNEPTLEASGNWIPISPDNHDNQNSPSFRICPDNKTYYTLYEKCVKDILADDPILPDPKGRVDYSDYLASKLAHDPAYKSLNPDNTIETEALSTSAMPETPAYYDHSGDRLNPNVSDNMDPLDPATKFNARGFEGGVLGIGEDEVDLDATSETKPLVADMASFYNTVIANGRMGLLSFFGLDDSYHDEALSFEKNFGGLDVSFTLDDKEYFKENWKVLNTRDKFLEFKSARTFIIQSNTGRPLKIKMHDDTWVTRQYQKFDLYWDYDIFYVNRYGDPTKVGNLRLENEIHYNWDHEDWSDNTKELKMVGGKTIPSSDQYDLSSREAHTDLKKLEDRDSATFDDKAEAMAKIAYYIAVSEGLDMAMKWIYQQRDKPYVYEAAKRLENLTAVKQSAKVAYVMYKGYVEWRRLMDILREIRDSRRALEKSFARFKRASGLLVDYYANLDYSKIRPTNITMLYPTRAIRYFDWSVDGLKYETLHFELAFHALNLDLDRFQDGPGKQTLAYLYQEGTSWLAAVDGENEKQRQTTHDALQGAQASLKKSDDNTSNYIRLSSLTKLAIEKTRNTKVKSLEASTTGLRNVLMATQSDSRDWLTMQDYATHNLAGSPKAFARGFEDRSPNAIRDQFDVAPVFQNTWVDRKIEELDQEEK